MSKPEEDSLGAVSHQDATRSAVGVTAMAVCKMRHMETENAEGLIKDPFAKALYHDDDAVEAILAQMLESQGTMLNGMAARTKHIDDEMVTSLSSGGFAQVVSLGAGLDTRPWRLALTDLDAATRAAAIKYYEVDFAEVFAYKLPRLQAAGAEERFAYTAVHADLSTPQWLQRLLEAGFTLPAPPLPASPSSSASSPPSAGATLFLLEGLTGYLTEQECTSLMTDLTRIAAPGSRLLATFLTPQSPPATHLHRFKPVDPLHYMSRSGHWGGGSTDLTALAEGYGRPVGAHFVGYFIVDVVRTQLVVPPVARCPVGLYVHASEEQACALVITGFGPFADVVDNPTAQIIHALRQPGGGAGGGAGASWLPSFPLKVLAVLEVSVAGVEAFLSQTAALRPRRRVYIHLGVDGGATRIKLESSCFNNSTFPVPDARGMQPMGQSISASRPLDFRMGTTFDCSELCAALGKEGFDVEVSDNPGRYLCNYVYYRSCCEQQGREASAAAGGGGGGSGEDVGGVIFIHVPPFSVVPAVVQIAFVRRATELLCGCRRAVVSTAPVDAAPADTAAAASASDAAARGQGLVGI